MTWRTSGHRRSWFIDSTGKLVVSWSPILSEFEDEEDIDPLDILTDRQRFVMELRYGLVDGIAYTQKEIAGFMGIDQSVVCRHEKAAIAKLRNSIKGRHIFEEVGRE